MMFNADCRKGRAYMSTVQTHAANHDETALATGVSALELGILRLQFIELASKARAAIRTAEAVSPNLQTSRVHRHRIDEVVAAFGRTEALLALLIRLCPTTGASKDRPGT